MRQKRTAQEIVERLEANLKIQKLRLRVANIVASTLESWAGKKITRTVGKELQNILGDRYHVEYRSIPQSSIQLRVRPIGSNPAFNDSYEIIYFPRDKEGKFDFEHFMEYILRRESFLTAITEIQSYLEHPTAIQDILNLTDSVYEMAAKYNKAFKGHNLIISQLPKEDREVVYAINRWSI